jgi:hypothetical protein
MIKFVFIFGSVFMGLAATASFAEPVPTARSCENLKAELALSVVGSDYSSLASSVMSPCLFERNIQLGLIYGLIGFPYLGDDQWEIISGHQLLFSLSVKEDLVRAENYASGLKVQIGVGVVTVESQAYKNKEFQKAKINSIPESDVSLGWYTSYHSWETNMGLIFRNFDSIDAYRIKTELMPRNDFGYQVAISYLIK